VGGSAKNFDISMISHGDSEATKISSYSQ